MTLTEIQTICDSLASCSPPIEQMQHIYIILNGVKGRFDNIIDVIHAIQYPYDIVSVSSVLLDAKAIQSDMLFDASLSVNVALNFLPVEILRTRTAPCQIITLHPLIILMDYSLLHQETHSL